MPQRSEARSLVLSALAEGIRPQKFIDPVNWAMENLVVPDGPYAGQKWDPSRTPYAVEILSHLSPESPVNRVTVRASAQVAKTMMGLIWVGYVIDICPQHMLIVFPTIKALYDFNSLKLQPAIDASPTLAKKVWANKSRASQKSSTTFVKRFPGGSIVLTTASSSADLRSKSVPFVFCDEIDEWELNLAGQGDPMKMVDARQISFSATGDWKKFECSTPTTGGMSRIDNSFDEGDQRYLHLPCPHCGEFQRLVFKNLKFGKRFPYDARYQCEECGVLIEHHHKHQMVKAGKWIAEKPEPGRHPSYHIDSLSSNLTTWDVIAGKFREAKDDQQKLKTFLNLWLGESFRAKGDAPPVERLLALREDYERGSLPPGGLVITAGADVQKRGIYYEVVAWGAGCTSWSIDCDYLPGDTADEHDPVWKMLDEVRGRKYANAYGHLCEIDHFAIDTKYNSGPVYAWLSRWPRHNTYGVHGEEGWKKLAISAPQKKEVDIRGKRKRRGLESWPVGSYTLKEQLYASLRKKGRIEGEAFDPAGYCHFGRWQGEPFFQQLTAEHVGEVKNPRGYLERRWVLPSDRDNHYLDCRVYAMAVAERLNFKGRVGITRWTDDDWRELAALRAVPPAKVQEDMFERIGVAAPPPKDEPVKETKPVKPAAKAAAIRELNERY